jgi:hypothetical protein
MSEYNLGTAPVESTPPSVGYKNRSTGLTVFGILTILLGCICALFVPLMILGQVMAAKTAAGTPPNFSTILPGLSLYVVLAAALIWLGIGSIKARRWARALLLIFSWSWLITGIVMVIVMAFLLPKIFGNVPSAGTPGQPALPSATMKMIMLSMMVIYTVIFVILPGIWTFFYTSRHVKATCEARDPLVRWTDACPLPVLACSLWLIFCAPMMLITPLTGHAVMPFFGTFLAGITGAMLYLVGAAVLIYGAWAMYKLNRLGWWLIFIALCAFSISNILTYARHDVTELYRLMGYPQAQIEQIQKVGLFTGNSTMWLVLFSTLPFMGYLIFIERYFRRKS